MNSKGKSLTFSSLQANIGVKMNPPTTTPFNWNGFDINIREVHFFTGHWLLSYVLLVAIFHLVSIDNLTNSI